MEPNHLPDRIDALRTLALEQLLDSEPVYVWVTDASGTTIWVNRPWIAFSGRDATDEFASSWASRVWPADLERVRNEMSGPISRREPLRAEYRIRRADGAWRDVVTHGVPYADAAGKYAGHVGITIDTTDQRASEDRAQALSEQRRILIDALHAPIFAVDGEGRFRFANRAWEKAFNATGSTVAGRTIADFFPREIERVMLRDNDAVLAHPGVVSERMHALPTVDGPVEYLVQKVAMPDAEGSGLLVCGVDTDLGPLRRAEDERRALEAQLHQARRLESLGVLAGGVAHDFNNLLLSVLGNLELALAEVPAGSPVDDSLQRAQDAARRAAQISGRMLLYSGRSPIARAPIALPEVVAAARSRLEALTPPAVSLAVRVAHDLRNVEGDAPLLTQVVTDLVTNALEALGSEPGAVVLDVRREWVDRNALDRCVLGENCSPGEYAILEVRDNGPGMDEGTRQRIFDPFFSTKFTGRGLGLPVALGVTRAHGGALSVESAPGAGTTVCVLLPVAADGAAAPAEAAAPRGTHGGRPMVLVVDDESAVRELMRVALERLGCDVRTANDGADALAAWKEHGATVDLVIADQTMPRMGGDALLAELRRMGATVPMILTSGYDSARTLATEARAGVSFLAKPFGMDALQGALKAAGITPGAAC